MRLAAGALLLATLSVPATGGGLSAQVPQTPPDAEVLREERDARPPLGRPATACGPAAPAIAAAPDTAPAPALGPASLATTGPERVCAAPALRQVDDDGGEWYGRRLTLHRYAAWTAVAAFPVEIYTGRRLLSDGADPEWVRDTHTATVWVLGTTFAANSVTGVWNWWDSRKEPEGRRWRTAHALVMVAADAAMFATARAGQAAARGESRERHQTLAFTTAGLTAVGHLMMLGPFRRD